jgi:DNA-binding transcriptional LysR family regulator
MLDGLTLHQLLCFDAVVSEGSFQAAADKLGRSQPSVSASIKNLESQLRLTLLDRGGYRVTLTNAGRSLHQKTTVFLSEFQSLRNHANQLAMGEESELRVVIGDLCPLRETLQLLRTFFDDCPGTRLHLHFDALSGPWERLLEGEADLILHHVDKSDTRFEFMELFVVRLVPVVAPNFLRFTITSSIKPEHMRDYVQCIIRDTARHLPPKDYYLLEGARTWTVSDQLMKRELILQGMGWGHLPINLIQHDLDAGTLVPITGDYFKGGTLNLGAARRRQAPHGPIAQKLWRFIGDQSKHFDILD